VRKFVLAQFRTRRGRAAALGLTILVASVSFVLLTASAGASKLSVHGSLRSNFRAAYDILVRPRGARTQLEQTQGLVRPNFLSGVFGGITLKQYEQIKRVPGVDVAAPIANIGYVLPQVKFGIRINNLLTKSPFQLYRIRVNWLANGGISRYPERATAYVYYTRRHELDSGGREYLHLGTPALDVCGALYQGQPPQTGPFPHRAYMACYSARDPQVPSVPQVNKVLPPGAVGNEFSIYFPIMVAAIDPVQEARLLHLDRSIVSGRPLRESDGVTIDRSGLSDLWRSATLASTRTYVDEKAKLTIERLSLPAGVNIPRTLSSPSDAYAFISRLKGTVVEQRLRAAAPLYSEVLSNHTVEGGGVGSFSYWTVSPVGYRQLSPRRLSPTPTKNPAAVWESPLEAPGLGGPNAVGYWPAPPANADVQFRRLKPHPVSNVCPNHRCQGFALNVVGRFDPSRLPGFSPLSQVPLETYYPPLLEPANDASRKALHGRPLLPTQNLGDYIQQPPLLLTTLKGMTPFLSRRFYYKGVGQLARAPIAAIRVRVKGVKGPDALSEARLRTVARLIHDRTGLTVDVTAGSSPKPILIDLPKGKFGRPELLLREGWSKKGASVSFLHAVDRKSLALLGLFLVTCTFFLANGALASVRGRRSEIGALLTVGWTRTAIFRAVLAELCLIGLVAGIVGTALAALIAWRFELSLSLWWTLLVAPLAILLAGASGLAPAWIASRGTPLDALNPPISGRPHARLINNLWMLALANLRRVPARLALGAGGLAVGVAALTILLAIQRAFQGVLVDTLLGNAISLQVHNSDFTAAALTIGLAALALADVLYLNLRDRAAELVTLRTLGWNERHLATLVGLEALALGLAGSLTGALTGIAIGAGLLHVPAGPLTIAALFAATGGLTASLIASLLPLSQINRLTPPTALAEE